MQVLVGLQSAERYGSSGWFEYDVFPPALGVVLLRKELSALM